MFPYYYSNVHHTVEKRASEGFFCVELAKGFLTPSGGPQVVTPPEALGGQGRRGGVAAAGDPGVW